jgi:hypothetical protein
MTWEEFQQFIVGKLFIIGLVILDEQEVFIEKYQTSGRVTELTDDGLLILKRGDDSVYQLPYEAEVITVAEKGDYEERTTGTVISNPDYIISAEIVVKDKSHIDKIKKEGFTVD